MTDAAMTDLVLMILGIAYYLVYRFIVMRVSKLKLIHSIWIPLIYFVGYTIFVVSLLQTPWFGANRTFLSALWAIIEVNLPVLGYLLTALVFHFLGPKNKLSHA